MLHQSAHKDTLCDELFGDYDPLKALSQVHTVVHQLRKDIANASDYIQIEYVNQTYRLVLNQVSVDKIQLDQLYEQLVTSDDLGLYQKAVDMFHKGLLTQVDWPWTLELQLKAEDKHIDVLKRMIDLSIQKQEYKALKNALIHYRPYVDELDLDEYVTIIRQHFNEAFLKQWVNETS